MRLLPCHVRATQAACPAPQAAATHAVSTQGARARTSRDSRGARPPSTAVSGGLESSRSTKKHATTITSSATVSCSDVRTPRLPGGAVARARIVREQSKWQQEQQRTQLGAEARTTTTLPHLGTSRRSSRASRPVSRMHGSMGQPSSRLSPTAVPARRQAGRQGCKGRWCASAAKQHLDAAPAAHGQLHLARSTRPMQPVPAASCAAHPAPWSGPARRWRLHTAATAARR